MAGDLGIGVFEAGGEDEPTEQWVEDHESAADEGNGDDPDDPWLQWEAKRSEIYMRAQEAGMHERERLNNEYPTGIYDLPDDQARMLIFSGDMRPLGVSWVLRAQSFAAIIMSPLAAICVQIPAMPWKDNQAVRSNFFHRVEAALLDFPNHAGGDYFPPTVPLTAVVVSRYDVEDAGDYVGEIRKLFRQYGYSGLLDWFEIPETVVAVHDSVNVTVLDNNGKGTAMVEGHNFMKDIECLDIDDVRPAANGNAMPSLVMIPKTIVSAEDRTVRPSYTQHAIREKRQQKQNEAAWAASGQDGPPPDVSDLVSLSSLNSQDESPPSHKSATKSASPPLDLEEESSRQSRYRAQSVDQH
ncbi:uncharacterized protein BDV17DRAFT_293259 [Aspergillus undulatus]|uniref:uncharacterized protein n=1 Tax=Aspergillus undulatus TaxID=1810928 RepID=UPI003CCCE9A9